MKAYTLGINLDIGFADATEREVLLAAKKAGFQAFFTCWRDWVESDSEKCRQLAALAKKENMFFHSIHAPFAEINVLWDINERTEYILQTQIDCIKLCAELSVPIMVVHPYVGFGKRRPTQEGIKNFAKIVDVAQQYGIKLAFENVEGEEYLAEIIKNFGDSPYVGLCWDTGHEQCYNYGHEIPELYANGKLFYTHCNDNLGMTDAENITWLDDLHLLPYDGNINWKEVINRLDKAGYASDVLTFELTRNSKPKRDTHKRYADWDLQKFMDEAYKCAKRVADEKANF